MNDAPWNASTAAALGVEWLLTASAPASEFGRKRRALERAYAPGDERAAHASISGVVAAAAALSADRIEALRATLAAAPEPTAALARAAAGDVLADVDFFDLQRFLEALADVRAQLESAGAGVYAPALDDAGLAAALAPGRTAHRAFYLADGFGPELAATRASANEAQTAYDLARGKLLERVALALGLEHLRDGEFTLMRAQLSAPLPPEVRVVHEAPTYFACELALDAAGLAALARRDEASVRVAEAEEAVRAGLSQVAARAAASLGHVCEALGELDALLGRARYAQRYAAIVPEIPDRGGALVFEEARYVPLAEALAERGRAYSPISLRLTGAAVVTGPNMGGKTAALRTCGFIAACVSMGLPVPAAAASVPLFDEIVWLGVASGSGPAVPEARLLSTFGAEVDGLRAFLERRAARPLVLIDEFARTTTPREGRALLVALLEILSERGARALAATHFQGVARDAGVAHYAGARLRAIPPRPQAPLGLGAALDLIGGVMDYALRPGDEDADEGSEALVLADVLGLDADLVTRARAALAHPV